MGVITRRTLLLGVLPVQYWSEDLDKLERLFDFLMLHVAGPCRKRVHREAKIMYADLVKSMRT